MRTIATAKVQRNYNCYNVYFNECLPSTARPLRKKRSGLRHLFFICHGRNVFFYHIRCLVHVSQYGHQELRLLFQCLQPAVEISRIVLLYLSVKAQRVTHQSCRQLRHQFFLGVLLRAESRRLQL